MLSSQEKAAAETFMKNSPSSSLSFESSMQAWHNTLTAGGIKKGNTIILNEALEDLEEGKLSLNSEQVTKFLEYLPQNWKSKITDDIVYNKIPKKDWSKFRDQKWVKVHSAIASEINETFEIKKSKNSYNQHTTTIDLTLNSPELAKRCQELKKKISILNDENDEDNEWSDFVDTVAWRKQLDKDLWPIFKYIPSVESIAVDVNENQADLIRGIVGLDITIYHGDIEFDFEELEKVIKSVYFPIDD